MNSLFTSISVVIGAAEKQDPMIESSECSKLTPLLCRRFHGLQKHRRILLDCNVLSRLAIFSPPFSHPQLQSLLSSGDKDENTMRKK